jgi:hypothetical protein
VLDPDIEFLIWLEASMRIQLQLAEQANVL